MASKDYVRRYHCALLTLEKMATDPIFLNLQADPNSLLVEGDVEIDMLEEMESYFAVIRAGLPEPYWSAFQWPGVCAKTRPA